VELNVSISDNSQYNHPLDVLRRFMPAPLRRVIEFENEFILVETNESSFFAPLGALDTQAFSAFLPAFQWKLLRDVDAGGKLAETTILMAGSLVVASMGPACLAGMDLERRELLAFIGGEVDQQEYRNHVFPVLSGLTRFGMGKISAIDVSCPNEVLGPHA
jgi:hypothetical protein